MIAGSFATAAPAGASTPSYTPTTSEKTMWSYINSARTHYGKKTLVMSGPLSYYAHQHSLKMAAAGGIFHTSNLAYTLRNFNWTVCGENVGVGPSVYRVHTAFMNSSAHKSNILYSAFQRVGVGIVWKNGYAYVTEMFANYG